MSKTRFSNPILVGAANPSDSLGVPPAVLTYARVPIIAGTTAKTFQMPTYGVLVDSWADLTTAQGSGGTISIGTTDGGTELMSIPGGTSTGRVAPTAPDATQVAAMVASTLSESTIYIKQATATDGVGSVILLIGFLSSDYFGGN